LCSTQKTQYPAACNSVETLLVQQRRGGRIPAGGSCEFECRRRELRGCDGHGAILRGASIKAAKDADWATNIPI